MRNIKIDQLNDIIKKNAIHTLVELNIRLHLHSNRNIGFIFKKRVGRAVECGGLAPKGCLWQKPLTVTGPGVPPKGSPWENPSLSAFNLRSLSEGGKSIKPHIRDDLGLFCYIHIYEIMPYLRIHSQKFYR